MTAWLANLGIEAKSALAPALAIIGLIGVAAGSIVIQANRVKKYVTNR